MVATYNTVILGARECHQVKLDVPAGQENLHQLIPIMASGSYVGTPMGLTLLFTYANDGPVPEECFPTNAGDQLRVTRMVPSDTASVNVIFKSVARDGSVDFTSEPITITQPAGPDTNSENPIFTAAPGSMIVALIDVDSTIDMVVEYVHRFNQRP